MVNFTYEDGIKIKNKHVAGISRTYYLPGIYRNHQQASPISWDYPFLKNLTLSHLFYSLLVRREKNPPDTHQKNPPKQKMTLLSPQLATRTTRFSQAPKGKGMEWQSLYKRDCHGGQSLANYSAYVCLPKIKTANNSATMAAKLVIRERKSSYNFRLQKNKWRHCIVTVVHKKLKLFLYWKKPRTIFLNYACMGIVRYRYP
jgi:hypothetical protein